jgi:hypothetical protein
MKSILSLLLATSFSMAQAESTQLNTPQDALNYGKTVGADLKNDANTDMKNSDPNQNIPRYSESNDNSNLYGDSHGPIQNAGSNRQSECQSQAQADAYTQQECDALNFVTRNPSQRPQFNIDKDTDPLIVRSQNIPPATEASKSQVCQVVETKKPATFTTHTCLQTAGVETHACQRILNVKCEVDSGNDGCDSGGIIPNSWDGDMAVAWANDGDGNFVLTFGTIANDYWSGFGAIFDRTLKFTVSNLQLISMFKLSRAAFDDWLKVELNGHVVYVGPKGGDRLEVVQQQISCGHICYGFETRVYYTEFNYGSPELKTSWNFYPDIDLKPYLVEGENTIKMRTVVAGHGEGAIVMKTRQYCPKVCTETWENQCSNFETRAQ